MWPHSCGPSCEAGIAQAPPLSSSSCLIKRSFASNGKKCTSLTFLTAMATNCPLTSCRRGLPVILKHRLKQMPVSPFHRGEVTPWVWLVSGPVVIYPPRFHPPQHCGSPPHRRENDPIESNTCGAGSPRGPTLFSCSLGRQASPLWSISLLFVLGDRVGEGLPSSSPLPSALSSSTSAFLPFLLLSTHWSKTNPNANIFFFYQSLQ